MEGDGIMRLREWHTMRLTRLRLGIKQKDAAQMLGINARVLNALENNRPLTISKQRDAELRIAYARLLDEHERKSKGGRSRSKKEAKHETHPQ